MFYYLEKENRNRILDADRKVLEKYKHRRWFLPSKMKKKKVIYKNYIPGAFGLNKEPDFVVPIEEENKSTLRVELKFISDTDVANMIYL